VHYKNIQITLFTGRINEKYLIILNVYNIIRKLSGVVPTVWSYEDNCRIFWCEGVKQMLWK